MKYVSIDIETTGLDPTKCQVLEIGAIIDDFETPVEALPRFRALIKHKEIHGEPYAMFMHAKSGLLESIARIPALRVAGLCNLGLTPETCMFNPTDVVPAFLQFLQHNGINEALEPAGKNFFGFDKPFLELNVPNWKSDVKIRHRAIDAGNLFWKPGKEYLPDSKTVKERTGSDRPVAHTALDDALDVVIAVRDHKRTLEKTANDLEKFGKFVEAFGYLQAALHPTLHVSSDPFEMAQAIVRYVKEPLPGEN